MRLALSDCGARDGMTERDLHVLAVLFEDVKDEGSRSRGVKGGEVPLQLSLSIVSVPCSWLHRPSYLISLFLSSLFLLWMSCRVSEFSAFYIPSNPF